MKLFNLLKREKDPVLYDHKIIPILNALIPFLDIGQVNDLYEKGKAFQIEYGFKDVDTDSYAREESTYRDIASLLFDVGLVQVGNPSYIIVPNHEARKLKQLKSYEKLIKYLDNRFKTEQAELWQKRNWWWIDFLKLIIAAILGASLTLGARYIAIQIGLRSIL
ncbi:hypothetical protein [Taibaiella koreensis]|uniref:hypothetical protein n=1 Tax=Taibaiella koreensis TaxID=1268548 RepID=UPI000E59973A|nr:hypothetical protein [Taibaiella koreensis]